MQQENIEARARTFLEPDKRRQQKRIDFQSCEHPLQALQREIHDKLAKQKGGCIPAPFVIMR